MILGEYLETGLCEDKWYQDPNYTIFDVKEKLKGGWGDFDSYVEQSYRYNYQKKCFAPYSGLLLILFDQISIWMNFLNMPMWSLLKLQLSNSITYYN